MSKSLLYPMTVSAKVVIARTRGGSAAAPYRVPQLGGDPFNTDAALEVGVHVHWALPDALTASRLPQDGPAGTALFPGVPDLWLVVRLNPGASSATPAAKRTCVAWVVDAYARKATPLASWKPPADRDPGKIHTLPGLLPHGEASGHPGWGVFDTADKNLQKTFQPAMAAYYPAARGRFGFYDSLADLKDRSKGNVTYFVVGWYWDDQHDPLARAARPAVLLQDWNSLVTTVAVKDADLKTNVSLGDARPAPANTGFNLSHTSTALPSPERQTDIRRATRRGDALPVLRRKQDFLAQSFPQTSAAGSAAGLLKTIGAVNSAGVPRQTICHGSVVGVPLDGGDTAPVPITDANVKLFPNVKRAMADLASKNGDPDQVNALEMLLGGLESQNSSVSGVLDMPGAAHALTFQSVPGSPARFARIRVDPGGGRSRTPPPTGFDLGGSEALTQKIASGHWPAKQEQAEPDAGRRRIPGLPDDGNRLKQPPLPADPGIVNVAAVRAAFNAAAKGASIHPSLVYVTDSRRNAHSLGLGPTTDKAGSDGAGWWLDINDQKAIAGLLRAATGAKLTLPTAGDLYTVPGPRWYRPWAPQVVLTNLGRSYKFGSDHRFRKDGKVQTRQGGDTVRGITVGRGQPVAGADLLATPETLDVPGLPGEVMALLHEALLLDTESADAMAAAAGTAVANGPLAFASAIRAVKFAADPTFDQTALKAFSVDGTVPSSIAVTLWDDPVDPLFVDAKYTLLQSTLDQWAFVDGQIEFKSLSGSATPTDGAALPPDRKPQFQERSLVTSTIVNVVKSAMFARMSLDPLGRPVHTLRADPSLDDNTFDKLNVISAALTGFDEKLFNAKVRLRAGGLRLDQLDLVDIFGFRRTWNAPGTTTMSSPHWTPLPPRLPYWGRLQLRLQGADKQGEASASNPPVVGLLVPDLVEHSLEVFDSDGVGIGQLTADRPVYGNSAAKKKLDVHFKAHPWVTPSADGPFGAIGNPVLRDFVASVAAQSTPAAVTPADDPSEPWETGLSAMLRVIDTIRGTVDPEAGTADTKVRLIGEPILVLGAQMRFEATATASPGDLAGNPALLDGADMPTLRVQIGDISRPDDGVLGCFIKDDGNDPAKGRFAPVSSGAATGATLNPLVFGTGPAGPLNGKVVHSFVRDPQAKDPKNNYLDCGFALKAGQTCKLVILADIRGGVYATCGALPRKKITLPQEFIDAAVRNLAPSFHAGPVLATQVLDSERVLVPPPEVPGYTVEFVCQKPDEKAFSQFEVPSTPPLGELPAKRVLLTEGWMRISKAEQSGSDPK